MGTVSKQQLKCKNQIQIFNLLVPNKKLKWPFQELFH